ncbi:exonuclease SbcCD subunit D [Vibrio salinus]|uniref:exonuclease SbcCD subunit D n=1 Tax=Vibrio salinus TaxID=2899784 RepID=UPI001E364A5A|nr:exonuclease SbcCD subunit D [Vibrio salinus]MCE0495404.1 exonuclease SbcCD subunit D [Vibrio salinus]
MKFIHTSDWHLGRQFHNVSLVDDQRIVLEQLIDYIKTERPDAVVIAGDIYDRAVPPLAAIELLNDAVEKICRDCQTPLIVIPGNHDSAVRLGFASSQMQSSGLYILSEPADYLTPVVLTDREGSETAFYGIPFLDPELARATFSQSFSQHDDIYAFLCEQIKQEISPERSNVLVAHCFVDGAEESDSERPLSIGGADRVNYQHFSGFDYVALGHLHQPQYRGEETVRYSGSLMKYSFSEQHQRKSVTVVEFSEPSQPPQLTVLPLKARRDVRVIEGYFDQILETGKSDPHYDDFIMVRLFDKHAILEPMERLRDVYPNVLHLEKPGMLRDLDEPLIKPELAHNEMDMFRDFFSQIHGDPLSEAQSDVIQQVIKNLRREQEDKQ